MHPPTPRSTPSPTTEKELSKSKSASRPPSRPQSASCTSSPVPSQSPRRPSDASDVSSRQRKRQRIDDGSTCSPSPAPLTPPHSSHASPIPESLTAPCQSSKPRADFNSLSPELQQRIIRDLVGMVLPPFEDIPDYAAIQYDPRIMNPAMLMLLHRRRTLTRLSTISSFWRATIAPMMARGPRIIVSASELSALAGNEYEIPGKTVDCPLVPRNSWYSSNQPSNDGLPARIRTKNSACKAVLEIVCWITSIPWRQDNSEIGLRWPRWYLLDCMRYDLEDLKVAKLGLLAAQQALLADTLNATIPNHERIIKLHLEVHHPMGPVRPFEERFENLYRHSPDTQHLCPRLLYHKDTLESLSFRNVAFCTTLEPMAFTNLQNLDLFFVNNWPGLCQDHFQDPNDREYNSITAEVDGLYYTLRKLMCNKPHVRVWIAATFDRLNTKTKEYVIDRPLLMYNDHGQIHLSPNETEYWWLLKEGALPAPEEEEEEDFSDADWVEDEVISIKDDEDDENCGEEEGEEGKSRRPTTRASGTERKIAPAPAASSATQPAHRPLKIR